MPQIKRPLPLLLCASALALPAFAALAQSRIVPADPSQFERVSLRQTVDDCQFSPANVRVSYERATIVVEQNPRNCFAPGNPEVVDIQLGAFPPGEYDVEVYHWRDLPPVERLRFRVDGLVEPAVFPPFPRPLADYSGIWMKADESGWGLSLHQGRLHTLFGAIYVFGDDQEPEWYTLQSGQWLSSTKWQGEVGHASGTPWSAASFLAASVQHRVVGEATLDFGMRPGREDVATLTYTIDGTTVSKQIARVRF
jgi:hypothetical protein